MRLKSWALPLLVAALIVPPIAGFAIGGPPLGLAIGAVAVASVVIAAARARFDEPIEVARAPRDRFPLLVVALVAVEDPEVAQSIAAVLFAGARATTGGTAASQLDVLVLAPAVNSPVAHWLSDVGPARFDAQRRLALSVATLSAAGLEARGQVGDADVVQAVEDTLRTFPAREVVFVTAPGEAAAAFADVQRRLDRPLRLIEAPSRQPSGRE